MTLRSQLGNARRAALSSFHRRTQNLGTHGPIVTFTFDDFPRSALTVGAPILENFGIRATYYVSMSLMNTRNSLGDQFRHEDLCCLLDKGHEIGNHTFSHCSARRVNHDAFEMDVQEGQRAIEETIGAPIAGNFAYPYGEATLLAKKRLGPVLSSSRGTWGGLNGPDIDLNLLRANSLYGDADRAAAAKELILQNESQRNWLIFYSHDVSPNPSPFGCTPKLLGSVCRFAVARGTRVMTVAEVMRELFTMQLPNFDAGVGHGSSLSVSTTNV
jgi:peptidoglycan/xylan/chitin deacetylase (PgdA/CDA1 family)